MRDPTFEPEAARDGQMDVNALLVPHLIGTQLCAPRVVMRRWREVSDCKCVRREHFDFLPERGRFLHASTSSSDYHSSMCHCRLFSRTSSFFADFGATMMALHKSTKSDGCR